MAPRTLLPGARRVHRFASLGLGLALVASLAPTAGATPPPPSTHEFGQRGVADDATLKGRVDVRQVAREAAAHPRKDTGRRKPALNIPKVDRIATSKTTAKPATNTGGPLIVAPDLLETRKWNGLARSDTPGLEPPDPWVAVNATYVVQSVNSQIRIYNKSGAMIVTVPTWAFFATAPDETDFDPRVIWDAYHGRWVALVSSANGDFSVNWLTLAVSETSNPTGAWQLYGFFHGAYLADYPALASSTDRIVITLNEFDTTAGFSLARSSLRNVAWSQILGGGPVSSFYDPEPTVWNFRPSQVLSTTADVHLIYELTSGGDVYHRRQAGTATAPSYGPATNLTTAFSVPANTDPPAPRQPGSPAEITDRVDGRVTDVISKNGVVWFTRAADYAFTSVTNSAVEVWRLTVPTDVPTAASGWYAGADGNDAFSPGIGVSGDGTLFFEYSWSSPTIYIKNIVQAYWSGIWSPALTIDDPGHTYTGTRWGDFVGIAADPSGSAAVWQANEFPAADGTWATSVSRLVIDGTAPTVTAPVQTLLAGTTVGHFTVPVRLSWTGADAGSGIIRWYLSQNQFHAGFQPFSASTASAVTRSHWWKAYGASGDKTYAYQAQAEDDAGNLSTVMTGPYLTPTVYNQTMSSFAYSSGWSNTSSTSYLQGSAKYSKTAGASVTFTASGRAMGFVSYKSSTRGKVRVYVDGVYKGLITLTSSTSKARQIVYATSWPTSGTHKVKLVVYSGRVDVDGFVVLR